MCPSRKTCLAAEYCFGELSLFWSSKYKADIIILYNVPCSRHDIDCSLALSKHHSLTMVHARCIAFTRDSRLLHRVIRVICAHPVDHSLERVVYFSAEKPDYISITTRFLRGCNVEIKKLRENNPTRNPNQYKRR